MLDAQKPVRVFSLCYQAWMFEIHLHMDKFYDVFLCAFLSLNTLIYLDFLWIDKNENSKYLLLMNKSL